MTRRRMLFKLGVTVVVLIGVILFYLVNIQNMDERNEVYKKILKDSRVTVQLSNQENTEGSDNLVKENLEFSSENAETLNKISLKREGAESLLRDALPEKPDIKIDDSSHLDSKTLSGNLNQDSKFQEKSLDPVIESPHQPVGFAVHLCVVVCGSRGEETMGMLKSAAMVTPSTSPIIFHIIAEPAHQQFFVDQLELWPKLYRDKVSYNIYNVTFPGDTTSDAWKKLFKPCASQRLFLPDLLKRVDSLIYVDTDTLFLRSLADLWSHFSHFNKSQLAGLVGEAEDATAGWYNRFANHPFYGAYGVNSGVMLMNLTRLRQTSWLSDMQSYYNKYRLMIPWGDQDLINIFFAAHPDQLFLMSCIWNFRGDHCKYMSNCKMAEEQGIAVLHGSRRLFYGDKEPVFGAVYESFKKYRLGDDLYYHFLKVLEENVRNAKPSNCGKVSYIFLLQLQKLLRAIGEGQTQMDPDTSNVQEFDVGDAEKNLGNQLPSNPNMALKAGSNLLNHNNLLNEDSNPLNHKISVNGNNDPLNSKPSLQGFNAPLNHNPSLNDGAENIIETNVKDNLILKRVETNNDELIAKNELIKPAEGNVMSVHSDSNVEKVGEQENIGKEAAKVKLTNGSADGIKIVPAGRQTFLHAVRAVGDGKEYDNYDDEEDKREGEELMKQREEVGRERVNDIARQNGL